jgi:hypothetical protein
MVMHTCDPRYLEASQGKRKEKCKTLSEKLTKGKRAGEWLE